MKKLIIAISILSIILILAACSDAAPAVASNSPTASVEPTATPPAESTGPAVTTIGYYIAVEDPAYRNGLETFKLLAQKEGWAVTEVVGNGNPPREIAAVQQFTASKLAAIVIHSNNPDTAGKDAVLANEAQIPIFFAGALPDSKYNGQVDGYAGYDIKAIGSMVGEEMGKRGAQKIVAIEGAAGEADTMRAGFIEGYKKGANNAAFTDKSFASKQAGKGQSSTAATAMTTAITKTTGAFNAIYIGSDEMVPGVLQALEQQGLSATSYIIGTAKGREASWELIASGEITFCVTQPPTLQADLVYQMVKAKFEGKEYKHYVNPYSQVLNKDNISTQTIPWEPAAYITKREANGFVWDLADAAFKEVTYTPGAAQSSASPAAQ